MSSEAQSLLQDGLAALRGGKASEAASAFERVIALGAADASTHLALAFARVNLGDNDAALAAVDSALAQDPRNLRALLFKADHLDRMGRGRSALGFYQGALQLAATMTDFPGDVEQALRRAEQYCEQQAAQYQSFLDGELARRGYSGDAGPRFAEALQIAYGNKPVHYQQPTRFYFPGLPQRAYYEREEFAWAEAVEAQTDAIRAELQALLAGEEQFQPYLAAHSEGPQFNDQTNVGSMDWSAYYLWQDGQLDETNAQRCPATVAALELAPQPHVPGQTPSALFSRLAPGASIAPHHGVLNTRLICHLPLIVPADCGALRVGNYERPWEEGRLLIFDDSVEHEAWNDSPEQRVVLLFDIWRPELTEAERHWVGEMLLAVDAYADDPAG